MRHRKFAKVPPILDGVSKILLSSASYELCSVTGFDDQLTPDGLERLTTFDCLFMEQARTAMRVAQQRVERPTAFPQRILHLARLIRGNTTAPPRELT